MFVQIGKVYNAVGNKMAPWMALEELHITSENKAIKGDLDTNPDSADSNPHYNV